METLLCQMGHCSYPPCQNYGEPTFSNWKGTPLNFKFTRCKAKFPLLERPYYYYFIKLGFKRFTPDMLSLQVIDNFIPLIHMRRSFTWTQHLQAPVWDTLENNFQEPLYLTRSS